MLKSYLNKRTHGIFILFIFVMWLLKFQFLLGLIIFSYIVLLCFFRRCENRFLGVQTGKQEAIYSPVNGYITSVKKKIDHAFFGKDLAEIRIVIPWWQEFGVRLPFSSKVIDLKMNQGKSLYRFSKHDLPSQEIQIVPSLMILFNNSLGNSQGIFLGMQLIKCPLGMWPQIRIFPGDRGKNQSHIGYFPFGGTVLLYLPSNYEILVSNEVRASTGVTILAELLKNE